VPDEPVVESAQIESPPPPDEGGSLADHEASFGPQREQQPSDRARAESVTPPAESPEPEPEAETPASEGETERDEKGRFLPKKTRHRAASQAAGPEDVPRIRELTARLRAAEAERDALKARNGGSTPTVPAPPSPVPAATPKPSPDQFQDYGEYIEALTDWKTDQKLAAAEQKRQQAEHERAVKAEQTRLATSWTQRVKAATSKYPDFEEIALQAPTRIPAGSLIDGWILEHKTGADVLYHLQKNPDDLDDLLGLPLYEQAERLALLSQRFAQPSRVPAAATGSAATAPSPPAPRPPNPVRTGPMRAGDQPPDEEVASLADHEKWYPMRRRRGA
jgi:hypothetical protein